MYIHTEERAVINTINAPFAVHVPEPRTALLDVRLLAVQNVSFPSPVGRNRCVPDPRTLQTHRRLTTFSVV